MKDFCDIVINQTLLLGITASVLILAYVFYQILFFILKRIFPKNLLVKEIRYPALFLFLEIGLFIALNILDLPDQWKAVLQHFVTILFIATIGWGLIKVATAFEKHLRGKSDQGSFITRAKIFYRTLVFLIGIFTFACILMTFPAIRSFGIGILGSAGIAGIALGIAARPMLLNLMAGFQIAFTKMLKIGDHVVIEKEQGIVEEIFLTHVIIKTPDYRRILYPISYFIDKPFENWDRLSPELLAQIYLHCDYTTSIELIRAKLGEILPKTPYWNHKSWKVEVSDYHEDVIELKISMSADNASQAGELKSYVREEMLKFLQKEHPESFPRQRFLESS